MQMHHLPILTLCLLVDPASPGRVLLGYKKSGLGAGKYTGFGGKVEPGESVIEAALREMCEESSIEIAADDLLQVGQLTFLFPHKPSWNQLVYLYVAYRWRGYPLESDEMRPQWFAFEEIPFQRMWQDGAFWLPPVLAGGEFWGEFTFWSDNETISDADIKVEYPTHSRVASI